MKNILLLITFILFINKNIEAQNDATPGQVFVNVEEQAEFPGGVDAMQKYIEDNLQYPEMARINRITGKCFLEFVVNETGDISNVRVIRRPPEYTAKGVPNCSDCDIEAIRLIRSMPKWKPAKIAGRVVKYHYELPINFKFHDLPKINKDELFTKVEEMPKFPGGELEMNRFIQNNLVSPEPTKKGNGCKVNVKFIVDESGKVRDPEIIKGCSNKGCEQKVIRVYVADEKGNVKIPKNVKDSIYKECNLEAIRVIRTMPRWTPGKQSGKNVNVYYNLQINFNPKEQGYPKEQNPPKRNVFESYYSSSKQEHEIFMFVQEMPKFPGGEIEMNNFIQKNLAFPLVAAKDDGCKVYVKFIVDETGNIVNPEVTKGCTYKECDLEAIRVIKMMPKWNPGKQDGRPVKVYYNLPITFKTK